MLVVIRRVESVEIWSREGKESPDGMDAGEEGRKERRMEGKSSRKHLAWHNVFKLNTLFAWPMTHEFMRAALQSSAGVASAADADHNNTRQRDTVSIDGVSFGSVCQPCRDNQAVRLLRVYFARKLRYS